MESKKVLIIRFSSIGDIVLSSPVIRSLKEARPSYEIHFLSKSANKDLLIHNPHLDKVHLLKDSLSETLKELKAENFDYILDLHHNLRSFLIKTRLRIPCSSFPKKNLQKYLMVRLKRRNIQLDHIVHRYGETLKLLGLELDEKGLELHLPAGLEEWAKKELASFFEQKQEKVLAVVLGAKHATKRWIPEYFIELLNALNRPLILLGGPDAREEAEFIAKGLQVPYFDTVGSYKLLESAALLKMCEEVISHDTGLMHIAAAFSKKIYSIWGNTVPAFGMTPYKSPHEIIEQKDLSCRPCSKIGYDSCPKGHFKCMKDTKPSEVLKLIQKFS
ncbi:MAG: glycosyltransferase family 9 protein [Bacteroidota bacterium]